MKEILISSIKAVCGADLTGGAPEMNPEFGGL